MKVFQKARDLSMAEATAQIAESRARSAVAGLPDAMGEAIAATLVIKLRRMPDSLGIDGGRTTALNAASYIERDGTRVAFKNPWNARGAAVAGSLTRRGKDEKRQRVLRIDSAHTVTHEKLHALNVESVRLHTLVDLHMWDGPQPSARKRKRFEHQLHGVQSRILDLGGSL